MQELIQRALKAREHAHAPYSQFSVGAAIETADGHIFAGCNVENASYGLSICAERAAACSAIAAGHGRFTQIVIVIDGPHKTPCGACRQFLAEFGLSVLVTIADTDGQVHSQQPLSELLPQAFEMAAPDS